jgi:hypothetical protein
MSTDNLLFAMTEPMVGKIVALQAKIGEILVVTVDPSTAHPWLVADSPSAVKPILVSDSFAIGDFDLTVERMKLSVANHWEHTAGVYPRVVNRSSCASSCGVYPRITSTVLNINDQTVWSRYMQILSRNIFL